MKWIYGPLLAVAIGAGVQLRAQEVSTSGATQADIDAAVLAATPSDCAAPLPDTLTGSAGTASRCMPRADATRPTVIQAKDTTTATDATWAVTYDRALPAPPTYVDARIYGATTPYLCTVQTLTATSASGKCYQLVATTLPTLTTSLLGLVVSPFQAAGAGLSVRVVIRQ